MKPGIELAGKKVLVVGLARTGIATALFCAERGARVTATEARPEVGNRGNSGEAARRGRHARIRRPPRGNFRRAGFDRAESRRAADDAGAGRRSRDRRSRVERNRTGLAVPARAADLHHGLERQDHDHFAHRPHPGNRAVARADRGKYRHAADLARGCFERRGFHGGRGQQLPARIDFRVSSGHRRAAQRHAGSSGPARIDRSLWPRQSAHV